MNTGQGLNLRGRALRGQLDAGQKSSKTGPMASMRSGAVMERRRWANAATLKRRVRRHAAYAASMDEGTSAASPAGGRPKH